MRRAYLALAMALLPAVMPAQDSDANVSARDGDAAWRAGKYTTAIYFLTKAVSAEPKHASAWNGLCRANLALDLLDAAIDACRHQIDIDPKSPGIYGALGSALWRQGKHAEAISAFQKQVEIDPSAGSHAILGRHYYLSKRYADAIRELEAALSAWPRMSTAEADLAGAYLATGRTDAGLAKLHELMETGQPSAATLNSAAYALADYAVNLDLAEQYGESAEADVIAGIVTDKEQGSVAELRREALLAACWDTLGWAYFRQGKLDKAESFIKAAWALNPEGTVGDHLSQVFEKRGQKAQAPQAPAQELIAAGKLLPDSATADFKITQALLPTAQAAHFLRGDERLRPFAGTVAELSPPGIFPDGALNKMIRLATLACPGQGAACSIRLLSASDAIFAELRAAPVEMAFSADAILARPQSGVTPPVPTYRPPPEYSEKARKKKIEGTVILYVEVDPTGHARNIKVVRSLGSGLDEKAIEAVSRWEFRPGMKDGQPVTFAATIEVNFRLERR